MLKGGECKHPNIYIYIYIYIYPAAKTASLPI